MRFNPFRKKRTVKSFAAPKRVFKNPFFNRESFADIFFRKLKVHYGLIVLLIFGLVYLFFYSELFQIHFIAVKGAQKISPTLVESFVRDELAKSSLGIFTRSNYFFFSEKSAKKAVKEKINQTVALEEFELKKKFPRTVSLTLKEVVPSLTWLSAANYYYLDKNGIVAQLITEKEVNQDFPLLEDKNNFALTPQEQIVSPLLLKAVPLIQKNLARINLAVDHFLIPELKCYFEPTEEAEDINANKNANSNFNSNDNQNENSNVNTNSTNQSITCDLKEKLKQLNYISVLTEEKFEVYFAVDQAIDKQVDNLNLVLTTKLKGKTAGLKYIDLRFENRIYYQ